MVFVTQQASSEIIAKVNRDACAHSDSGALSANAIALTDHVIFDGM